MSTFHNKLNPASSILDQDRESIINRKAQDCPEQVQPSNSTNTSNLKCPNLNGFLGKGRTF